MAALEIGVKHPHDDREIDEREIGLGGLGSSVVIHRLRRRRLGQNRLGKGGWNDGAKE